MVGISIFDAQPAMGSVIKDPTLNPTMDDLAIFFVIQKITIFLTILYTLG